MKKAITLLFFFSVLPILTRAQVICIYCYNQNDSISSGVNNLLLNGGFETTTCLGSAGFCPNSSGYSCDIANWTCTGGGTGTYAQIVGPTGFSRIVEGIKGAYFGNWYCRACSAITNDTSCINDSLCRVTHIPAGYPQHTANYGGTTGISLQQTVNGLVTGSIYVLEFWAGGEGGYVNPGLFAVDVGFGNTFLRCRPTPRPAGIGTRFIVVFRATLSSHTIKFTNWGHISSSCTELALDNVRLYTLPELSASVPLCPNCAGIEQAPDFELGNDTSYCSNSSFSRTLVTGDSTTLWSTGAIASEITVNAAGTYWASVNGTCGPMKDTIVLSVDTIVANVNIGNDTSYCGNFTRILSSGKPNTLWNTGSTSSQITINTPGTFWARVTNGCGMSWDTIEIASENAIFNIGNDTMFCVNINRTLSTGITGTIWSTGDTASQITVNAGGVYWARVDSVCGASTDTINIIQGQLPSSFSFGNDTTYCVGFSRILSTGIANTLWSNGVTAPQIMVTNAGTYWARVTNACGSRSDTVVISQTNAPNTFSFGSDVTYCSSFSRYLSTGNSTAFWSTGVTASSIYAATPGTYWARVSNACGTVTDTIVISQQSAPLAFSLGSDVVYCNSTFNRVLSTGVATTIWSTGAVASQIMVSTPGTYWARVSNYCGTRTDTINLSIEVPPASFSLGNDTAYCGNFSRTLSTGVASTFWSSGAAAPQITVTSPGTYWAMVSGACGIAMDTIVLSNENAIFNLGSDTLYCSNFSRTLNTGVPNTYWSTGITDPQITVDTAGTYWARIDSVCGASTDTIIITRQNRPAGFSIGNDTTYCGTFSRILSTGIANTLWSNGLTAPQITVTSPSTYRASVTNVCGTTADTIVITRLYPPSFNFGSDLSYCGSFSRYLNTGISTALWSTGVTAASIYATTPGTYWAVASNVCGTATDTIVISAITLPPAFTLGSDTTYCSSFTQTLSTGVANTVWSTGVTAPQITVTTPGTYRASISNSCGTKRDTIIISQLSSPANFSLGSDIIYCSSFSAVLNTGIAGTLWSTGNTASQITVTNPGTYWARVANACGTATDTIVISTQIPPANFNLGNDLSFCGNFTQTLSTGIANTVWSTGQVAPQITVTTPGTYWAVVLSACGTFVDTIVIDLQNVAPINLGADTAYCGSFTRTLTSGNSNTLWSNGMTGSQISVNNAGTYWATASSSCGTNSDTIVISQQAPAGINLGNDVLFCDTFNRTLISGNANTLWSTGVTAPQITVNAAGIYWARITNACGSVSDTISFTQGAPHVIDLGNDTSFCNGQSFTIDASNSNSNYRWQDNSTNATLTVTGSGIYSVTVTTQGGCTATDNIAVNVLSGVSLSTSLINTSCGNSNGAVSVIPTTGNAPFSYRWNNGDTTSSITNIVSGTYNVTATDVNQCSATASAVVNPSSTTPVTIASDKSVMCSGDSAQICAPLGFASYLWNTAQTTPCIYVKLGGNYYVTATDANHCTAASNHLAVSVYPLPPVSISVNGDTLTAYNAITYQWYLNGNPITNANSNIYIAAQGGSYSIVVTDSNGCAATSSAVIISSIDNLSGDVVSVYPNPLDFGLWTLECGSNMIGGSYEILDANGRLVFQSQIQNPKSIIELSVAKGVYLLRINSAKSSIVRKLIRL